MGRHSSASYNKIAKWESLEKRNLLSGSPAIWTGAASDGLWSDSGNWQAGAVPSIGQDVQFSNLTGDNAPQIVQVDQAVEMGALNIDNTILQGTHAIKIDGDVTVGTSDYVAILAPITLTHTTTLNVINGTGGTYSDLLLSGTISDGGHGYGLTITGGGQVDLIPSTIQNVDAAYVNAAVNESYTGPTTVNDNSIVTFNAHLSSSINVSGNAEVYGSGSLAGLNESDTGTQFGASDPFNWDTSVVTVANGAHFNAGSVFFAQMDGVTIGNGTSPHTFSELDVLSGTINLGSATLDGNITSSDYTPKPGDVITVIKNQTGHAIVGTFANLPEGTHLVVNGTTFAISYHGGTSGRDVTLTDPTTPTIRSVTATEASSGKTAVLNAIAADPTASAGQSGLTYTWSVISVPTGAKTPLFSANGTNAAKEIVARLYKAGAYRFSCTVTNAAGGTATTTVRIVVTQLAEAARLPSHTQGEHLVSTSRLGAVPLDQFDHPLRVLQ